ncbi:MAG: cyclase family protein [Halobacteriales archaeon]|nr:cyclase family protein [Halobacteriales archaeon]
MVIDLTLPLNDRTLLIPEPGSGGSAYPTDSFQSTPLKTLADNGVRISNFSQHTHTGTHTDAPAHFIDDGRTIEEVPLDRLTGEATVIDLRAYRGELITPAILETEAQSLTAGDRAVFVTGDVDTHFHQVKDPDLVTLFEEASAFSVEAAEWIADREPAMIANDFVTEASDLAIDKPYHPERPGHKAILGADIPIVEYLCNVDRIADAGTIELSCLPLPLSGLEAAPTRAIATR